MKKNKIEKVQNKIKIDDIWWLKIDFWIIKEKQKVKKIEEYNQMLNILKLINENKKKIKQEMWKIFFWNQKNWNIKIRDLLVEIIIKNNYIEWLEKKEIWNLINKMLQNENINIFDFKKSKSIIQKKIEEYKQKNKKTKKLKQEKQEIQNKFKKKIWKTLISDKYYIKLWQLDQEINELKSTDIINKKKFKQLNFAIKKLNNIF